MSDFKPVQITIENFTDYVGQYVYVDWWCHYGGIMYPTKNILLGMVPEWFMLKGMDEDDGDSSYWLAPTTEERNSFIGVYSTPPPTRRPLSSLTEEEASECFRVAFDGRGIPAGYAAMQPAEIDGEVRIRQGWDAELIIFADGSMSAFEPSARVGALRFNATRVVRFLDGLGIQLG